MLVIVLFVVRARFRCRCDVRTRGACRPLCRPVFELQPESAGIVGLLGAYAGVRASVAVAVVGVRDYSGVGVGAAARTAGEAWNVFTAGRAAVTDGDSEVNCTARADCLKDATRLAVCWYRAIYC